MRAQLKVREFSRSRETGFESLAEHFSASIQKLKPSLGPAELVRVFTEVASEMLHAEAAVAALIGEGGRWEIASRAGSAVNLSPEQDEFVAVALGRQSQEQAWTGSGTELLGLSMAKEIGWASTMVVAIPNGRGGIQGALCLAGLPQPLDAASRNLLGALVGHAGVALENSQMILRIEQSRRQWVKDFDAITDFIVVHNSENVILRINRSLANWLQVPLMALLGRNMDALSQIIPASNAGACPFCDGPGKEREDRIHVAAERTYLVSTSWLPEGTEEGARAIHVLKDITDRQELERRYRELFDNIQEGLFFCTPEGKFLEVNHALVRMLGYSSREELLGVNLFEQLSLRPDRRRIEKTWPTRSYEEALRRKDGGVVHTSQKLFAVRDAGGRLVQYRGLMLDVTEQKIFQAQLQRERDFNKNILDNTQSMIVVLDTARLISYANRRCFEAGYREQTLLGRPLAEIVPLSHRPIVSEALDRALHGAAVENLEIPVRLDDGRSAQFSVSLSPMRDEDGIVNSLVAVMTDITEAVDLQNKMMHTEKLAAVGQLVAGVAHEVNNPLAAILGFTDLLLENEGVSDTAKDDLRVILAEAQRTKTIVQNLLSFARQMPAQRELLRVNSVLQQTLRLRTYDRSIRDVDVIERLDPQLPLVAGDAHQLQQVFLNILNNAFDAIAEVPGRGRIEIESAERDGYVEIHFRDNGPGISHPERIFEPFFTTKEVGKGTGLGLSICYGIVRSHHGEILCRNNSDAPGGTFTVRLPAAGLTASVDDPVAAVENYLV
ncbi:MAG: PAS domain S-box protein [Candidatus Acidiferrales bacterium]